MLVAGICGGFVIALVGLALGPGERIRAGVPAARRYWPRSCVVQDFWRFAAFSRNRARAAAANDAVWAVVQAVCVVLLVTRYETPAMAMVAWGSGAVAGAFLGCLQFRLLPSLSRDTLRWARRISRLGGWFGLSNALYTGASQAVAAIVAAGAGAAALGGLRAAQTLLGPAQLVAQSGDAVALPAASRQFGSAGRPALTAFALRYGGLLTAVLGAYGAVLIIGRDDILRLLLGEAFVPYANLILPLALGLVATSWSLASSVALRAAQGRAPACEGRGDRRRGEDRAGRDPRARRGRAGSRVGRPPRLARARRGHVGHVRACHAHPGRAAGRRTGAASRGAPASVSYPDFYLVGAPKCGTTALYDFLRQHPQIFLPREKELLRFASDLSYPTRLSEEEFLAHFAERDAELRAGTAHTAYMQSTQAAREIKEKRPDADIVVMLRNPVEMLHSWHSELLYETIEEISDFEAALDAEPDRRRGERIPRSARNSYVESLFYSDVAAFAEQVKRYLDTFGRSHIHVILHEDLRDDPSAVYRDTLGFLDVEKSFTPEFGVLNPNKAVRSPRLQRLYFGTAAPGHRLVKGLIPRRIRQRLLAANARPAEREEMHAEVRRRLERMFRDDVARLGELIERDLSGWIPPR